MATVAQIILENLFILQNYNKKKTSWYTTENYFLFFCIEFFIAGFIEERITMQIIFRWNISLQLGQG